VLNRIPLFDKNAFWIKSVALDRFSFLHLMFRVWHMLCDVWCTLSGLIFEQKRLQISNFWKKSDIRAFDFPQNSGRNSEIIRENLVSEWKLEDRDWWWFCESAQIMTYVIYEILIQNLQWKIQICRNFHTILGLLEDLSNSISKTWNILWSSPAKSLHWHLKLTRKNEFGPKWYEYILRRTAKLVK
jgi:hypothetical protein